MGRSPNADRLTSAEQPMVYAVRSAVVNPREAQASTGVFSCAPPAHTRAVGVGQVGPPNKPPGGNVPRGPATPRPTNTPPPQSS